MPLFLISSTQTMHIKSINHCYVFPKNLVHTLAGFEPGVMGCSYLVKLSRHRVCGAVGIGLVQQRLNGGQDGGHVVGGAPAVLQDVQADP
jgi:hypothetical protein